MSDENKPPAFNYEEREAIRVIRKSMLRKPAIIEAIFKDQAYTQAHSLLLQAKVELAQLLEVNRAFIAAASVLAEKQKADKEQQHE